MKERIADATGHESYRVHCRLKQLMTERGLTVEQLHSMADVSREPISQLRSNNWKGVSKNVLGRLCGALGIGIGELLELLPEDIWLPIRLAGEVTVHFGSRAVPEPRPVRADDEPVISRQYLGSWDFRAFQAIHEYLRGLKSDIRVAFTEHITGPGRGSGPAVRAAARSIFEGGNHVVVGSPIANQFTEEVVCKAYGVPPHCPQMRDTFPYGFEWDHWRQNLSSFGWQGQGKEFGIVALPSGEIVAPQVIVRSGEGTDAALILVYRVFKAPVQREMGDDDERIVICLLGYSGPGTLAAAMAATRPDCAAGLYPAARGVPRMRAVRCTYIRTESPLSEDNREVTQVELVPESDDQSRRRKPPAA